MRRFLYKCLIFVPVLLCLGASYILQDYSSRKIAYLAEYVENIMEIPERDTIIIVPEIIETKAIVFRYNDKGDLSHIGVSLFSEETKFIVDEDICNFLERTIFELLVLKDRNAVCSKLREYRLKLYVDGKDFATDGKYSIEYLLDNMHMPASFYLNNKGKVAEAIWTYGKHKVVLEFPLSRELVTGTDKKESDDLLYDELKVAAFDTAMYADEEVGASDLEPVANNVFVRRGVVYAIKELSSDVYYSEEGGKYVPLFSPQYPLYSMNNLFLTYQNGKDKKLSLTHRKYGSFTPEVTISFPNFLNVFSNNFTTVCHTGFVEDGKIETIVVFTHKVLNYIHILRATTTMDELFSDNTVIKADFYSNIPQHYIKSLLK